MNRRLSTVQFHSCLGPVLGRFLADKRAAGYLYREEAVILRNLDQFFERKLSRKNPVITIPLIREFLERRNSESDSTRAHWLTVVRQFCQFLSLEEPRTAIPGPRFLGLHRSSFVPRVLTQQEGRRFIAACKRLTSRHGVPMRGPILSTLFIVLYLAGLRTGEVVGLTVEDVDLERGVLRIRNTKFGKSRLVPIASDVVARLRRTKCAIEKQYGECGPDAPFFPSPYRNRGAYAANSLHLPFQQILAGAGIPLISGGRRLRIHDLRHSFAVLRLHLWYKQRKDPSALLPFLATYMGHVGLEGTQTYLQLTEETIAAITRRHNARFGYLIKEGNDHA
jgi:integrase/recombinase XerD